MTEVPRTVEPIRLLNDGGEDGEGGTYNPADFSDVSEEMALLQGADTAPDSSPESDQEPGEPDEQPDPAATPDTGKGGSRMVPVSALAQEREAAKQAREELERLKAEQSATAATLERFAEYGLTPDEVLATLQRMAEEAGGTGEPEGEAQADESGGETDEVAALRDKVARIEQDRQRERAQADTAAAEQRLQSVMGGLKEKYPEMDADLVEAKFRAGMLMPKNPQLLTPQQLDAALAKAMEQEAERTHKAREAYAQQVIENYTTEKGKTAGAGAEASGVAPSLIRTKDILSDEDEDKAVERLLAGSRGAK